MGAFNVEGTKQVLDLIAAKLREIRADLEAADRIVVYAGTAYRIERTATGGSELVRIGQVQP